MARQANFGLVGLGTMGRNLCLNLADHGHCVAVHDRDAAILREFAASSTGASGRIVACDSLETLTAALNPPRAILLMITAGEAVDHLLDGLAPLSTRGDVVIDGGNSHFRDTIRRGRKLRSHGHMLVDAGISGGERGARLGASIMAGGTARAYSRVESIFRDKACQAGGMVGAAHMGSGGAGHFVKIVHNGIEYAVMQLIAETYFFMKNILGLSYREMKDVFVEWRGGDLEPYLVEITGDILGNIDAQTARRLLEVILDSAGGKGTGKWAVESALELAVPVPTIAEAVSARFVSALREERTAAAAHIPRADTRVEGERETWLVSLQNALRASTVCSYAQGFAMLRAAAGPYGWHLDLGAICAVWQRGAIVRASLLERAKQAFESDPPLASLLTAPDFRNVLRDTTDDWRRIVAAAAMYGLPVPALGSSLAYFEVYRSDRLWANLIQAQRDHFGAHTYERVDTPGAFHTEWADD